MIVLKNYVSKQKPLPIGSASSGSGLAPARKDKMKKINTDERPESRLGRAHPRQPLRQLASPTRVYASRRA
ncbi:MAG: hypothetical protein L6244_08070 [Candidatus Methanoperedenaceae archaeon]|nr:hypothetical protein [Euryarchaeota archaeon]MCG2728586.1 hypothetical protein [Candidatus Methanoperedenaceae archaeon]